MTTSRSHIYFSKLILHIGTIAIITGTSACQPSPPITLPTQQAPQLKKKSTPTQPVFQAAPQAQAPQAQAILPTQLHQITHKSIQFNLVTFDTRTQHLIVADQPKGPGSSWPDSQAAAKAHKGIAAINAGFFTPEGEPLGIVISNGTKRGSYNTSSLGTGIFYHTVNGASISRRSSWAKLSTNPPAQLLQSGPMLLEHSKPVAGLSTTSSRPRSFIATDGQNHWCFGHAESCTLAQLSEALSSLETAGFKPTTALNLDGGRSSDLWVSTSVAGGSKTIRPFWNKPVRNFLILKSK